MKLKRPVPKEPWNKERYESQIKSVENDMRDLSANINYCDKKIRNIMHEKRMLQLQESKKAIYLNQLKTDLEHIIQNWEEI